MVLFLSQSLTLQFGSVWESLYTAETGNCFYWREEPDFPWDPSPGTYFDDWCFRKLCYTEGEQTSFAIEQVWFDFFNLQICGKIEILVFNWWLLVLDSSLNTELKHKQSNWRAYSRVMCYSWVFKCMAAEWFRRFVYFYKHIVFSVLV